MLLVTSLTFFGSVVLLLAALVLRARRARSADPPTAESPAAARRPFRERTGYRVFLCVVVAVLATIGLTALDAKLNLQPQIAGYLVARPSILRLALTAGLDPNYRVRGAGPLLVIAVRQGNARSVQLLLDSKANPDTVDMRRRSARRYALTSPDMEIFGALMRGLNKLAPLDRIETAELASFLVTSAEARERLPVLMSRGLPYSDELFGRLIDIGDFADAELLLASDAQARVRLRLGDHPGLMAPGHETLLSALLGRGADPGGSPPEFKSAIHAAIEHENFDAFTLLRPTAIASSTATRHDPLALAVMKGMTGAALALLKDGLDPDVSSGAISATDAAEVVMDEVFLEALKKLTPRSRDRAQADEYEQLLSFAGYSVADRDSGWRETLTAALKRFQQEQGLFPHGHPSAQSEAALLRNPRVNLFTAAAANSAERIAAALAADKSLLDVTDGRGWSPLMHAAHRGNLLAVETLLAAGASVKIADRLRHSNALHLAAASPAKEVDRTAAVIRALLASGGDKDLKNDDGMSAASIGGPRGGAIAVAFGITEPVASSSVNLIAVMKRPAAGRETYVCQSAWPQTWIKENWDKGLGIAHVVTIGGKWCVLMAEAQAGAQSYLWVKDTRDLSKQVRARANDGQTLVTIGSRAKDTVAVFAKLKGVTDGWFATQLQASRERIESEVWKRGFAVDGFAANVFGSSLVVYGEARGYRRQAYAAGSLVDVLQNVGTAWKAGKHLTAIGCAAATCGAVLSEGANAKDQKFLAADDLAQLGTKISDSWKAGWSLQFIVGVD